jgi:hypothetical protein
MEDTGPTVIAGKVLPEGGLTRVVARRGGGLRRLATVSMGLE